MKTKPSMPLTLSRSFAFLLPLGAALLGFAHTQPLTSPAPVAAPSPQLTNQGPPTVLGEPSENDRSNAITEDALGNVYIAGATTGYLDTLDPGSNIGGLDPFVAKYDSSRNLIWVRQIGLSTMDGEAFGVDVNAAGDVFVAGTFIPDPDDITMVGAMASFVSKYDSDGVEQWTETRGSPTESRRSGSGVVADDEGNVYLSGSIGSPIKKVAFVEAYRDVGNAGNVAWCAIVNSPDLSTPDCGNGVALDTDGNIYLVGSTLGFAGDSDDPQGQSAGQNDVFIASFEDAGSMGLCRWKRQIGTGSNDVGYAVTTTVDLAGDSAILIAGSSDGGLGGFASLGGSDAFLARYDTDGFRLWTEQLGTDQDDECFAIATDDVANIYIAGSTEGDFDVVNGSGTVDVFTAMFRNTTNGAPFLDAKRIDNVSGVSNGNPLDVGRGVTASRTRVLTSGFSGATQSSADAFIIECLVPLLGDVNCDGVVDLLDVAPFVDLLTDGGFSEKADIDGDGVISLLDVDPFVDLITG